MHRPSMSMLRKIVCTAGWTVFCFMLVAIAVVVITDNTGPVWRAITRIGIPVASAVVVLWFGVRGWLPGTERNLTRQSLMIGPAIILVAIVLEISWMGSVLGSRQVQKPQSPEHARSVAEALAILDQPVLRSIGISQAAILAALDVPLPLTPDKEEAFWGHKRLVGYNRQDRIEVNVQGPENDVWSTAVILFPDSGQIDPQQPSVRRVRTLLDPWMGKDVWEWISQMTAVLMPNGPDEQRVQRSFGDRSVTVRVSGPGADTPR